MKQFLINVVGDANVSALQPQNDESEQNTQPVEQESATPQPTE